MSRFHSYLNSAKVVIHQYDGSQPLSGFLKELFSAHKKYGSKDRKHISHLCYCYCRTGKAFMDLTIEEKILTGLFLCSTESHIVLQNLMPEWNDLVEKTLSEKLEFLGLENSLVEVFPFVEELSDGIDHDEFVRSFFIQPDLFIRIRPGHKKAVLKKLEKAELKYEQPIENCVSFSNNTKIDDIVDLDREAVVQDFSSQQLSSFLILALGKINHSLDDKAKSQKQAIKVWDCCAASGGKSILLKDIQSNIDLTVSDIRKSILVNLEKRFKIAGIKDHNSFVSDLSKINTEELNKNYDLIIADVPCSGSGTWSRTPEQLAFFEKNKIGHYVSLQEKIVSNAIPQLNEGGAFIYITCSVFQKENEGMVNFIKENLGLSLLKRGLIKGYDKKADSMFVAVFTA